MSFTGTHTKWFTRVQTTASLEVGKNNDIKRSPLFGLWHSPPLSATQVVKRTSVLRKLTRTSLSEGRMSGMRSCGQRAREPVIWLTLLPESGNKGILVHLSPLWGSPWTRPEEFLPQGVMILTSRSASWGPPSSKRISSHIVQRVHILVCNIILSIFCDITLTSAGRNVCQFTNLSHPSRCLAHHSRVSLVYERFVFWEVDEWEVCASVTVFDVFRYRTSWWKMFQWSEEQVTAAPRESQSNCFVRVGFWLSLWKQHAY